MVMKLKDLVKQLDYMSSLNEPILFLDHDSPEFIRKYRHTKNLPFGFYDTFNYELDKHIDQILDLEVTFIRDKSNVIEIYVKGLKEIFSIIKEGDIK